MKERERESSGAFGCFVSANGLLVDVCQCLFAYACMLTAFETLSLL